MLVDTDLASIRPLPRAHKRFDAKGLYLLVTPTGACLWRFKYRFPPREPNNKERLLALGAYPEVSLDEARERRDLARRDLFHGMDPGRRRLYERLCVGATFEEVAREFLAVLEAGSLKPQGRRSAQATLILREAATQSGAPTRRTREPISAETVHAMRRTLERHVFPYLGSRELPSLQAPELLAVLRRIEARGTFDLAHRVRSMCSRVLRYARATGRHCEDIAADLIGTLIPVRASPRAAITEPEKTGQLLRSIASYHGAPLICLALQLVPYVFTRPKEFRTMEWAHVRLDARTPEWRVPWQRMKMREPHIVPLSRQAIAILHDIQQLTGEGRWVFPQLRNPHRPMSEACLTAALRAIGYSGTEMTWHGFRALASTQLNELGWNERWIETQLSHADRSKVRSAYNHAKYLPQRRAMMQAWADYLDSLRDQTEARVTHDESTSLVQPSTSQRVMLQFQAIEVLREIMLLNNSR